MTEDLGGDPPEYTEEELRLIEGLADLTSFLQQNILYRSYMGSKNPSDQQSVAYAKTIVNEYIEDITAPIMEDIRRQADLSRAEIRALSEEFRQIALPELRKSHEIMFQRLEIVLRQEKEALLERLKEEGKRLAEEYRRTGIEPAPEQKPAFGIDLSRWFYTVTRQSIKEGKRDLAAISGDMEEADKRLQAAASEKANRIAATRQRALIIFAKFFPS